MLLAIPHGLVWGWLASHCLGRAAAPEILLVLGLAMVACVSCAAEFGAEGGLTAGAGFLIGIAAHRTLLRQLAAKGE